MKTKQEIVENWLPRYTDRKLEEFDKYGAHFGTEEYDAERFGCRHYDD